jgi:Na+:H+ antiporter, NhaA family
VTQLLPHRPVVRLTRPFVRFMELEAAGGAILLAATLIAMTLANTAYADDYAALWDRRLTLGFEGAGLSYPLWYWINDGLMAIFFFVIGLEIKRELTWGELRDRRNVALPAIAAVGGAVVPVAVYLAVQPSLPGRAGWAVPMATDIAFVVGCLAVLGKRVPPALKVFMLSLAIIDDLVAVVVIAVAFSASLDVVWLAGAAGGVAVILGLGRLRVRRIDVYAVVGAGVWLCTLKGGLHPTIAGVVLGLLTPATAWVADRALGDVLERGLATVRFPDEHGTPARREAIETVAFATTESVSPLERLEHALHPWVAFVIMPVFALANAGVNISVAAVQEPVALAVVAGLVLGKPIGIAGAAWLAIRLGVARLPDRTSWPALIGAAWLGGIGFTMALFIASLAITGPTLGAAKAGILVGSALSAACGMGLLVWALPRRQPDPPA